MKWVNDLFPLLPATDSHGHGPASVVTSETSTRSIPLSDHHLLSSRQPWFRLPLPPVVILQPHRTPCSSFASPAGSLLQSRFRSAAPLQLFSPRLRRATYMPHLNPCCLLLLPWRLETSITSCREPLKTHPD